MSALVSLILPALADVRGHGADKGISVSYCAPGGAIGGCGGGAAGARLLFITVSATNSPTKIAATMIATVGSP